MLLSIKELRALIASTLNEDASTLRDARADKLALSIDRNGPYTNYTLYDPQALYDLLQTIVHKPEPKSKKYVNGGALSKAHSEWLHYRNALRQKGVNAA